MRRAFPWIVGCVLAAAAGGVVALALRTPAAGAQEVPRFLYVSGMAIDGDKPRAIIRLFNSSTRPQDVVVIHYNILGPTAGAEMSEPNAGIGGEPIFPGTTLELDLGKIVTQYRASLGATPYKGRVQFVATSDGSVGVPLTPERVAVDATQVEGSTRYQANVEWR